ncbi:MAG: PPC domain-containing protein [Pirellulaceae bacterium]
MRRLSPRIVTSASLFAMLLIFTAVVQASSPTLSIITPRNVQRGAENTISFNGARLTDAEEILFYSPGFEVVELTPEAAKVTAKVNITAECRLGEHVAHVRCKSGLTEYRTFWVGPFGATAEVEPNSSFDAPQKIELNTTVHGVVTNEDVDYYAVELTAGQRISAEIEAMRLGTTLFDPYIAIIDAKRFELSADDDTPLTKQDAVASAVAKEAGTYYVMVRESSYAGNGNCRYNLHVGTFPRPLAVYPAGGKIGETIAVRFVGDPTGVINQSVQLPAERIDQYSLVPQDANGVAPSGNPFMLSENGNSLETEPNESVAEACAAELPNAFNGIIQAEGDIDCFKFTAKKGQVFDIECFARRLRSPLDPVMNLYNAAGGSLVGNDDSRGPDSYFRYTFPADGEYVLRITDHLKRGGDTFVYRVEFRPVKAELSLGIPRVARYSQSRQQIYVPRGGKYATLISASRANFGGDITIEGNELPQGVTMHAPPMPANMSVMPVVFEAAADAPIAGKLMKFQGKHIDPATGIAGHFKNRADLVVAAPGQSLYVYKDVEQLPIAVVDELPFRLEIVQPNVPIVQNGEMALKVLIHRKEGFNEAVTLQFPFRPPGIGTRSTVVVPAGGTEAVYPLNAAGNAQVREWPMYVLGSANVNGTAWVSSQLATLSVAAPYVGLALERAACEQGQETQLYGKITQTTAFEGSAKVELLGLPNLVTTTNLEFDKAAEELTFNIQTDKTSPAGKHTNVFCRVTIMQNGEPIVFRTAATTLQIDKPLPPPPNAPPKPMPMPVAQAPKPMPAPMPMAKPLTRLEKLRLAAKQRVEGNTPAGSEEK